MYVTAGIGGAHFELNTTLESTPPSYLRDLSIHHGYLRLDVTPSTLAVTAWNAVTRAVMDTFTLSKKQL